MDAREAVAKALETHGPIEQFYWIGCGGSLIDLIPADYMMNAESAKVESRAYTAKEFVVATPKKLGAHSMVVALSHSGGTPEVVEALKLAEERGAFIWVMTSGEGSAVTQGPWDTYIYVWEDETPQRELDSAQAIMVCAELMKAQEGFDAYDAVYEGIEKLDGIIAGAKAKVESELCKRFAELCTKHDFFYIMGSGAAFAQTYGFSICSLMEMQWQSCCYIHSAEYFHGPFEVTEPGVFYFLQMSSGPSRVEDERALAFVKTHTDTYMVLDALAYGMDAVDARVRAYLEPIMIYYMNVKLRAARGKVFDHDPHIRRYMGIEQY